MEVITVILVSYHTGPVLFEAINSLIFQPTIKEIILVDNGNPPEVLNKIRSLAIPKMNLITGYGNIGFSAGCNLGAKHATGEYLLFLNPDSVLEQDLAIIINEIDKEEGLTLLGARILNEDGSEQITARRNLLTPINAFVEAFSLYKIFSCARVNNFKKAKYVPAISGAFMFIRHNDFHLTGGFDEKYFLHVEDMDFCMRITNLGGKIRYVDEMIVRHYLSTSDAPSKFIEYHKTMGAIYYFNKFFNKKYPVIFLKLLQLALYLRYLVFFRFT